MAASLTQAKPLAGDVADATTMPSADTMTPLEVQDESTPSRTNLQVCLILAALYVSRLDCSSL